MTYRFYIDVEAENEEEAKKAFRRHNSLQTIIQQAKLMRPLLEACIEEFNKIPRSQY